MPKPCIINQRELCILLYFTNRCKRKISFNVNEETFLQYTQVNTLIKDIFLSHRSFQASELAAAASLVFSGPVPSIAMASSQENRSAFHPPLFVLFFAEILFCVLLAYCYSVYFSLLYSLHSGLSYLYFIEEINYIRHSSN